MSISRDGLSSYYLAPAGITDHSVAAKFGSLGELNFQFKPMKGTGLQRLRECEPVPTLSAIATGVYLEAIAGSWKHGTARKVGAVEYRTRGGRRSVNISGFIREEREGMILGRGATVTAGAAAFSGDLKAGTATLRPPAPFTGYATLKPGRDGKGIWEGSLRVPVLDGGEPIQLTGPDFVGRLYEEEPFDE